MRRASEEAAEPFDLTTGPLIRVRLYRLGPLRPRLVGHDSSHRFRCAGPWVFSCARFSSRTKRLRGNWNRIYPLLNVQYPDFAKWQRSWLQGEALESQLAYWRQHLDRAPATLDLPTDRPRPPVRRFVGDRVTSQLPSEIAEQLRALGREEGATLFMVLFAAFNVLLHRYSGQDDVVVGTPIANRSRRELEPLIGFFVNTLAIRTNLSGNPTFRTLLQRVREAALGAYAHQDLPFERLVEELHPERDLSRSPIFQAMFVLQNAPKSHHHLPGLTLTRIPLDTHRARFDVVMAVNDTADALNVALEFNTDLFDASTMERLLGHFATMLQAIAQDGNEAVGTVPILTESEREALLHTWNQTQAPYPVDRCVHELLQAQASRRPDAIALDDGDRRITYRELNERANRVAHRLLGLGVNIESRVAVCAYKRMDAVIGSLAIMKAGAAYIPLDPAHPLERLQFMLDDSGANVLLADRRFHEAFASDSVTRVSVDDCICNPELDAGDPVTAVTPENLAYAIYTSGSTGWPKAVLIEHRSVLNLIQWHQRVFSVTDRDRTSHLAGPAFDASVWELWPHLTAGATVCIPPDEIRISAEQLRDWFVANQITIAFVPTPLAEMMVALPWPKECVLRSMQTGGEALSVFPPQSLPFELVNNYGPTENTVITSSGVVAEPRHEHDLPALGRPIDNVEIYVLDCHRQPVPVGVPGELHVGGSGIARAYLNRPELTAEKFIPHPFSDSADARLYRTGDMVRYRPDGSLEFLGRNDDQVKLRGYRIELGEIQRAVYDHPNVATAAVLFRPSCSGDDRIVAYIVWKHGYEVDLDNLRSILASRLPAYMVPAAFVQMDVLPLTRNGKINVSALPPPEEFTRAIDADDHPQGPTEEAIAAIWCAVLGINRIGRTQRFFDSGGHSLKATQVMSRMRDAFGVELPLRTLFEVQTVEGLAARVESEMDDSGQAADTIVTYTGTDDPPLSFSQQRLWFLDRLGARDGVYTISTALRLRGDLNIEALERALNHVVRRHDVLRTYFGGDENHPVQKIDDDFQIALAPLDLSDTLEPHRTNEVSRIVQQLSLEPFDLRSGPLVRVALLQLGDKEHVLNVSMHHAISDGWSMGVFARELTAFYNAEIGDEYAELPGLPIQYADFSAWQRDKLRGQALKVQMEYWTEHLRDAPAVLELPTDHPRPAVQTFNGGRESFRIERASWDRVEAMCSREGVTPFMALCAAFDVLIYRYTGQEDFVIGTPIANRNRAEIENLIGFFANTLALRFHVDGQASFRQLLNQVRDVALGAFSHQDVPFEKLVEELAPERSLSRSPLFQVMFALQNVDAQLPKLRGLDVARVERPGRRSRFDLTVTVSAGPEGLSVNAEYNADLFDADTIHRMLNHYAVVISEVARTTDAPVATIPLLTEAERRTLLYDWNDTAVPVPLEKCVHQRVEIQASRRPGVAALIDSNGRLTYGELNRRANRLAHRLVELRVHPRTRVAVCTSRRMDTVVAELAVLKVGAAYVPLDPSYPVERLRYMVEDSSAVALITDRILEPSFPPTEALHVCIEDCFDSGHLPDANPDIAMTASDPAYAIYTSGSTGRPKGVLIEHRGLSNLVYWHQRAFHVTSADRATHVAGPAFDASVWELWPYLSAGATVYIADEMTRVSASHLRLWILEHSITISFLPTPLAEQVIGMDWPASCPLRALLTGGDALHKRPPPSLPFRVVNNYGPTENTVVATSGLVETTHNTTGTPALGRPIDNTEILVLDRNLQLVPVGVPGELHVGGFGLARGYLNRPDLTAERFISHPFRGNGCRLYKTGDIARYRSDGSLEFLGRADHQVKIRGYRVELGEIESVLCRQPGIEEAVVLPRANGPSGPALAAFVVPASGQEIDTEFLRDALNAELPSYMIPTSVTETEAIPLSAHGKVDRDALLKLEARTSDGVARPDEAPSTATQQAIAAIWCDLLERERVGIHENFLDSGGHSLLAVELLSRINAAFHIELPLRTVFEEPTIMGLARRIDLLNQLPVATSTTNDILVPLRATGSRPPIFLIAPAGGTVFAYYALAHHLGPDQPVYALQDPAYEGNRLPCDTIEGMARLYIEAMRAIQPKGPYLIGGWSFGGTVAFEMAHQLSDEVGLLFLIETITGVRAPGRTQKTPVERLKLMYRNLGARASLALSGLATTWEGVRYAVVATRFGGWLRRIVRGIRNSTAERSFARSYERALNASAPEIKGAGTLLVQQSVARHWIRIAMANARAFRRYTPTPFPGKLTLFLAKRRLTARPGSDPARGWSPFAEGGVDVRLLPGDHFSILRNPNVVRCAQILRDRADQAQTQTKRQADRETTPTLAS